MAIENSSAVALERLRAQREHFTQAAGLAKNSQRDYTYAWAIFKRWAAGMNFDPLPCSSETLALFVTAQLSNGLKATTVRGHVAGILWKHKNALHPSPITREIAMLLRGAKRLRAEKPRQVLAITVEELRAIAVLLRADRTPISTRNLAAILVGFCAALRGCNITTLMLEDIEFTGEDALLQIRRSKTDQDGVGKTIAILHGKFPDTCVIRALKEWIEVRGSDPGLLFRRFSRNMVRDRDRALMPPRIAQIVQATIYRIGKDKRLYGSHSLRAGFCTETGLAGAPDRLIAATTGHTQMSTVGKYFRPRTALLGNPLKLLDL